MKIAGSLAPALEICLNESGLMFINQKEYWNKFYSSKVSGEDLSKPSQFAAFVLGESFGVSTIIDVGCGNA